jgi:putative ABC transport system permease protein
LLGAAEPEQFPGAIRDPGFFAALGVAPMLGRTFNESENQPGQDGVVLLGYGLWKIRFGDASVLAKTLELNGRALTVIGVMPPEFVYPPGVVMWSPLALDDVTRARRDFHRLRVIARLKDGLSLNRARSDYKTIGARLDRQYPDLDKDESVVVDPMLEDMVGQIRPALMMLLVAVAFVLLIACANVANLLLAKAAARRREIAVRASLGAAQSRILGQMLTESLTLSAIGGAVGWLFAYAGLHTLLALAPATLPRLKEVALD